MVQTSRLPTQLPTGTVTFLFTDIEGSTRLVERLGTDAWAPLLEAHQRIIRAVTAQHRGHEIKTEGDSFFIVFGNAGAAVRAAVEIQRALERERWPTDETIRVRIGIHTGEGVLAGTSDYVGLDVHRAARIAATGHGGQVVLSAATAGIVESSLPPGVTLRDHGQHRLKDLSRPERIFDLAIDGLPSDFQALRTLEARPNNLPPQLTRFLGRQHEIEEVLELLGSARLLTLTGPGGTGKTRLSLEVAGRAMDRFGDGVYFVPLAPIFEADLVGPTIAQELRLPERGGRQPLEKLLEHLRDLRLLLVLDNFEQVVDAAPIVGQLVSGAPNLTVLVTSRFVLHVYGEREYPVPPLRLPDAKRVPDLATLHQYESVALFVDRASAVKPDFRLTADNAPAVAEICARLDGLPLAIELAAARIKLLSPQAMLARLSSTLELSSAGARDLPTRQQTLRGAIAWSHDLLNERDRTLFACLSVFVGGASLEMVESMCSGVISGDVLDALSSLVDKSFVRQLEGVEGEPRFAMLETIREFARERLDEMGRTEELLARHAELFCSLVDQARGPIMGTDKRRWLDRLEEEHDNLRAAYSWAVDGGHVERALKLAAGLWRFWQMRGHLSEGLRRVEQALALPGANDDPELRIGALDAAGGLAYWSGEMPVAQRLYEEALELRRGMGDMAGEAEELYNLSFTYTLDSLGGVRDLAKATDLTERSLSLFRAVGDKLGVAKASWSLSNGHWAEGRLAEAKETGLAALSIFREADDRFMVGWTLYTLGLVQLGLGEFVMTFASLEEALDIFVEAGDVSGYVLVLDAIANLAFVEGDLDRAALISGGVAELERTTGTGLNTGNRELTGFDPQPLRIRPAWEEGAQMGVPELIAFALRRPEPVPTGIGVPLSRPRARRSGR